MIRQIPWSRLLGQSVALQAVTVHPCLSLVLASWQGPCLGARYDRDIDTCLVQEPDAAPLLSTHKDVTLGLA